MNISTFTFPSLLAALALTLSGCGPAALGYSETVSRLESADRPPYWLDNDRVLIAGYAPDDKLLGDDGKPKKGLYILDTRNNSYTRYADLGHYSRLCYDQEFVTYTVSGKMGDPVETNRQMEGTLGQEKMLPKGVRFNADFSNNSSYTDCPRVDPAKRLRVEHAEPMRRGLAVHAIFLRQEDGYILADICNLPYPECTIPVKETFNSNVKLYQPGRKDPIDIPILAKELALGSYIRYVEWANKYLIVPANRKDTPYGYSYRLTGKAPYQIYLMTPSGQIETIPIPEGKWLPSLNVVLTRAGLYLNGNPGTEQGEGGWWLKPNGKLKRIFDLSGQMGLSPDGCKLAVSTSSKRDKPQTHFVRIVDFCSKN